MGMSENRASMLTRRGYERLKEKVSISPYKYGPCWKLCGGLCCDESDTDAEYYLEFFPFEEGLINRRMFPRLNRYQVECGFLQSNRVACGKPLYCHLAPSHPAFYRGGLTGVFIDPEIEACPLTQYPDKVSGRFMRAAFQVWKEVLSLLPPERVDHYRRQYRRFRVAGRIQRVWTFD